jgi:ribosome production factor 1
VLSSTQIAQIQKYAADGGFTNLLVFHETKKFSKGSRVDGLLLVHLPAGPSAMFRVSNVKLTQEISGHGRASTHTPELILNNFTTGLGHRVGRMLASLLPQDPEFRGRRVITLHNQRDYIFFRHHRYVFEQKAGERKAEHTGHLAPAVAPPPPGSSARKKQKKKKKSAAAAAAEAAGSQGDGEGDGHVIARLQELGPRFTMKLQSLQKGVFDPTRGEFEWVRPAPGDAAGASRRKFFL